MERIKKPLSKNYLPAKFFVEDLESIYQILSESSQGVDIIADDYKYSTIDELFNQRKNQSLSSLKMSSGSPYVSFEIEPLRIWLYSASDNTECTGLFYKLDTIISASLRKPTFAYSYFTFFVPPILFNVLILFGLYPHELNGNQFYIFISFLALCTIWILWVGYIRIFKSGKVILAKKSDWQSFLARNKESLIVNLIVAVFSVALTFAITKYLLP